MKINATLLKEAGDYVAGFLPGNLPETLTYHNLSHTRAVVAYAEQLADAHNLGQHKRCVLGVAAWFHDVGYAASLESHEELSAAMVRDFLFERDVDPEEIAAVQSAIRATRMPQTPNSKIERILCDADMLHLSDDSFMEKSAQLREEWRRTKGQEFSDEEWFQLNYDFIRDHCYQTDYARENCSKEANLLRLMGRIDVPAETEDTAGKTVTRSKKENKLGKGVETLFRNASRNHMELSAMADSKAHILLSVSSLIVSVIISFVLGQLSQKSFLILPTAVLLTVCLATIVIALLTTKPKISRGTFTAEQIRNGQVNLLFFGNFHRMDIGTYEWGVNEMMHDEQYLYNSMTKDIYYLGKVLAVKYRYLNIGYAVFMYGIIASVAAFCCSYIAAG